MKLPFGLELSRQKAMTPVPNQGRGLWRRILEPFAGAWQQNVEETRGNLLAYPTLYACLNRISQDIGKLPFRLVREDENGVWSVDKSNTAYWPVLRKPNQYQTAQQFREYWVLSKLMDGNTYALKGRDERGVVTRLWILDPANVMPLVSTSGDVYYQLQFSAAENLLPESYPAKTIVVPASEIIHDRLNTFHHQLIGVPPLCAAYWPAVKNLRILQDAARYFQNGAKPSGILTAPAGISDEDAEAIKAYWNTNFTGEKAGNVGLVGADLKYTPFSFNASDSQLVEQMRYSDEQICQAFSVPPFIIGRGTIPAGLKADDIALVYYQFGLQSLIEAMENLLDEGLGVKHPQGVELDLEPLMRMDVGKLAEIETKLTSGGVKTPNEARLRFNLSPLDGGDTVYMQQQDYPLDQVRLNKIEQAPAPAPAAPEDDGDPIPDDEMDEAIADEA